MKGKVLVFAGTTEGRELSEYLAHSGVDVMVRVATEYGKTLVRGAEASSDRLGDDGIEKLIDAGYRTVVDATHPYAARITEKIRKACDSKGAEYIRLSRPQGEAGGDIRTFPDLDSAIGFLRGTEGNIFAATGSKELDKYTSIEDYEDRVFARVLSLPDVAARCSELGFRGRNLFCMQGPYSEEMNYAMLRQTSAKYLVTKDSGHEGGLEEKLSAARRAGATVILIGRPPKEEGMRYWEVMELMSERFGLDLPKRRITIVGKGVSGMTSEAERAVREADAVFGAKRMIAGIDKSAKVEEYRPEKVLAYLRVHQGIRDAAVVVSGDVGFYSGAKALLERIDRKDFDVRLVCGISSPAYLCAKVGMPWEDVRMTSAHGREGNPVGLAARYGKVFALLGGKTGVRDLIGEMIEFGLGEARIVIGSDLGTESEAVIDGRPIDLSERDFPELSCALIINDDPMPRRIGIPDEEFIRGDAPMTKQEARAVAVSCLNLAEDSVVYDVGAGTGSVAVECAMGALGGRVYAIEKESSAASLIRSNTRRFKVPNVTVVEGTAPEALADLPPPTHAFIGGSSGNLKGVVSAILSKSPCARICVASVTLETLSEVMECARLSNVEEEAIVCISSSRAAKAGRYHLMKANNPIYMTILRGAGG